ncbi:hypothetical protein [Flammeovirga pacifica]|nr:hypothetical protein [Flammeovirga pacifica]
MKNQIENMLFDSDNYKRSPHYSEKEITLEQADSVLLSWNLKRL